MSRGLVLSLLYKEENSSNRHILLTPAEAEEYQRRFGGENYYRIYFGLPLREALEKGFLISRKGYFETTHAPAIQYTALTIRNLLVDQLNHFSSLELIDLFTGTGQAAWAFASVGFHVTTVELDKFTYIYSQENLKLAGVSHLINSLNTNAIDVLTTRTATEKFCAAIFLDPPWNGKYDYDLSKPFYFHYMELNAEELISKSIQIASIVVIKTPQNIDREQVKLLGENLNCHTIIQFQRMPGYEPRHNPASVFFLKDRQGFTIEQINLSLNR